MVLTITLFCVIVCFPWHPEASSLFLYVISGQYRLLTWQLVEVVALQSNSTQIVLTTVMIFHTPLVHRNENKVSGSTFHPMLKFTGNWPFSFHLTSVMETLLPDEVVYFMV